MMDNLKLIEATAHNVSARYYVHKDDAVSKAHAKEILEEHGAEGILVDEIQIRVVEQSFLT